MSEFRVQEDTLDDFLDGDEVPFSDELLDLSLLKRVNGFNGNSRKFFDPEEGVFYRIVDASQVECYVRKLLAFAGEGVLPDLTVVRQTTEGDFAIGMESYGTRTMQPTDARSLYHLGEVFARMHGKEILQVSVARYDNLVDRAVQSWIEQLHDPRQRLPAGRVLGDKAREKVEGIWSSLRETSFVYAWDFADCRLSNVGVEDYGIATGVRLIDIESVKPTLMFRGLNYMMHDFHQGAGLADFQFKQFRTGYIDEGGDFSTLERGRFRHQEAAMTFLLWFGRLKNTLQEYHNPGRNWSQDDKRKLEHIMGVLKRDVLRVDPTDKRYARSRHYCAE